MHERLGMVGGTLSIKSRVGKGTHLRAEAGFRGERLFPLPGKFGAGPGASKRPGQKGSDGAETGTKQGRAVRDSLKRLHQTLEEIQAQRARLRELSTRLSRLCGPKRDDLKPS
jgi:hypothetical protein